MTDHQSSPTGAPSWSIELLGREYEYVTESSFHSDNLRNQYIQLYIILTGAALSGAIAVAQFDIKVPPAILSLVAILIGLIGVLEVAIFVRLRAVVIECLQATVLLKEYALRNLPPDLREQLASAFLWDAETLPNPLNMLSASSLLVVLVIILDSTMFGAAYLLPQAGDSKTIWIAVALILVSVVIQVFWYRWRLDTELAKSKYETKLGQLRAGTSGKAAGESQESGD